MTFSQNAHSCNKVLDRILDSWYISFHGLIAGGENPPGSIERQEFEAVSVRPSPGIPGAAIAHTANSTAAISHE
jgi:hypothetical protein